MAEETEPDTGLCEHHLEHTDVCGYSPGSPATPCNHEHTSACWVTQEECIQKNMVSSASPEDTEPENEPAKAEPIPHECSEDTGRMRIAPTRILADIHKRFQVPLAAMSALCVGMMIRLNWTHKTIHSIIQSPAN